MRVALLAKLFHAPPSHLSGIFKITKLVPPQEDKVDRVFYTHSLVCRTWILLKKTKKQKWLSVKNRMTNRVTRLFRELLYFAFYFFNEPPYPSLLIRCLWAAGLRSFLADVIRYIFARFRVILLEDEQRGLSKQRVGSLESNANLNWRRGLELVMRSCEVARCPIGVLVWLAM